MSLDFAILGLLAERPRTGYDLKTRCFDTRLTRIWPADQAQIYRTLDRLQQSKMITAKRRRQPGRPERRIYELTPEGRWTLEEWLATPSPPPTPRDPLHLQLYFGGTTPDEELLELLAARRHHHQERLDSLREHAAAVNRSDAVPEREVALRQTAFDGAIAIERALIDWIDDCMEAVRDGALPGSSEGIGQRHLFGT